MKNEKGVMSDIERNEGKKRVENQRENKCFEGKVSLFSGRREIERALEGKETLVLLCKGECFTTNTLNHSLPSSIVSLLQEFHDIFPDEIPDGLPPMRGIEHRIDFVPGATLPNRPAYRANPEDQRNPTTGGGVT